MVDVAPTRERWISPHALLGSTSVAGAGMTTAGLLAGPAGVAAVGAASVLATGAVAAVRRRNANKLAAAAKADGKTKDKKKRPDKAAKTGLRGLLGNSGRGKGHGAGPGGRRAGGLLGTVRRAAGKGADLAKRGAVGTKNGLLGGKKDTAGPGKKGMLGGTGVKSTAPGGKKTGTRPPGTKPGAGGTRPAGGKRNNSSSPTGGKKTGPRSRIGRGLAGAGRLIGRGIRGLVGSTPGGKTDQPGGRPAGAKPDKNRPVVTERTGPCRPGLLGSNRDRDRAGKPPKPKKDKATRGHRPTRDAITSGPAREGRRAGGHSTMPNPFESRREAISGAAPLEIERAVDLIDYVTHAPDYAEAQAKRWEHEANAIIEKINITPEFAESLKDFAAAQHQQVTRVREYGETFRRGHADRLAKLDRADPREAKWDISVNQG